jgi:hypothetical protein
MVLPLVLLALPPVAQIEAEACEIVCAARNEIGRSAVASGGKLTPAFWGGAAGDRVTWTLTTEQPMSGAWLAVRYAYGKRQFGRNVSSPRRLRVLIGDNHKAVDLLVPDTGSWGNFSVAWVRLPSISPGSTRLVIESPEVDTNTDIDCLGLFTSRPKNPPTPFVASVVAASPRFVYRKSPSAEVLDPKLVLREFGRIGDEMRRYGGWTPAVPTNVNAIEEELWPDRRWAAYSNADGLFLRATVMAHDQGNWCHEMTHLMFQGRIPRWFDESLVHFLTKQVWVPRLYPDLPERAGYADDIPRAAEEFRRDPSLMTDSLEKILNVVAARFGADVYGRFMRCCLQAGKAGELELRSERQMTTAETMLYLTKAAGEDVTPYFRHWSGFDRLSP